MKPHKMKLKHYTIPMGFALMLISCGEKGKEAVKEIMNKAENKLVQQAGEGEVALALMRKQYLELKERLVRIKTLTRTLERRAAELDERSRQLASEGKVEMAERQKRMAESYRNKKKLLEEKDATATEELKNFAVIYEEAKADIQMLKEEIEMVKSMGGLNDNLGVESPLTKRMDTVKELTEKMRNNLDRAQALLDVNEIEKGL